MGRGSNRRKLFRHDQPASKGRKAIRVHPWRTHLFVARAEGPSVYLKRKAKESEEV